jgi:hypothetical protein
MRAERVGVGGSKMGVMERGGGRGNDDGYLFL